MLELFTRHGGFDLALKAKGDLDVDQHHTVEDVGITLGETLLRALGDRKGINRAGYFVMVPTRWPGAILPYSKGPTLSSTSPGRHSIPDDGRRRGRPRFSRVVFRRPSRL